MKSKNRLCIKNLAGALAIPVLVAILLQGICMAKGKTMIMNMTSFDNFVVYIAIVMITTIALSINLNSGRFDFSLLHFFQCLLDLISADLPMKRLDFYLQLYVCQC